MTLVAHGAGVKRVSLAIEAMWPGFVKRSASKPAEMSSMIRAAIDDSASSTTADSPRAAALRRTDALAAEPPPAAAPTAGEPSAFIDAGTARASG